MTNISHRELVKIQNLAVNKLFTNPILYLLFSLYNLIYKYRNQKKLTISNRFKIDNLILKVKTIFLVNCG